MVKKETKKQVKSKKTVSKDTTKKKIIKKEKKIKKQIKISPKKSPSKKTLPPKKKEKKKPTEIKTIKKQEKKPKKEEVKKEVTPPMPPKPIEEAPEHIKIRSQIDKIIDGKFLPKSIIDDIILKDEFDKYDGELKHFNRYYVLDKCPDGWSMGEGRITKNLLDEKLFGPSDDTVIFVCGPPMMQIDLKKQLIELGHPGDKVIFP